MRCIVLVLAVAWTARTAAAAAASCAHADLLLGRYNVSADENHEPGADACKHTLHLQNESLIATWAQRARTH